MMNESAKEQFKWKFWYNAVLLNGVIFFFALGILAIFLFPISWRIPGSIICLLIAVIFAFLFRGQYLKTKEWLSKHA
jgi:predicted membrane-bound dolichyl-phosphate-mannose-protein mannosyltransferase